jgi:T5orf172 domain
MSQKMSQNSKAVSQVEQNLMRHRLTRKGRHRMSILDVPVLPQLYPCEFCQTLCPMPANEPPECLKRGSRCEACAPGWASQRFTENQKGGQHPAVRRRSVPGVYVVELVLRPAIVKVGYSQCMHVRVTALSTTYGPTRWLYALPTPDPQALEHTLHHLLEPFRLYEQRRLTELFAMTTRKAQRLLAQGLRRAPHEVIEAPSWVRPRPVASASPQLRWW